MPSIALLGATGNLGRHVAREALARGWQLRTGVRNRGRLAADVAERAQVHELDLASAPIAQIAAFAQGCDVFVSCAGTVSEGERFVRLFATIVSALETLPPDQRPVCWFLAGGGLLQLDSRGRRGVDLPVVRDTYWPHRKNFERLQKSALDWRLLCPGPMVEQPAVGLQRLRISIDVLPTPLPAIAATLPAPLVLPMFAVKVPEMIIPYADAAAVMLANVQPHDAMSRHCVGVALPVGMRGRKEGWVAQRQRTQ